MFGGDVPAATNNTTLKQFSTQAGRRQGNNVRNHRFGIKDRAKKDEKTASLNVDPATLLKCVFCSSAIRDIPLR